MKKIINLSLNILSIILIISSSIFGQTVTTTIHPLTPSTFYLVEPGSDASYSEINVNIPQDYRKSWNWSATGGITKPTTTNLLSSYFVNWNNSNEVKKVKVELTYEKPIYGSNNTITGYEKGVTVTDEKIVTVKYIGNILSMYINGVESGNGGTQNLSCSSNVLTVSCSVPETNPSVSLFYDWIFPSGWSPSTVQTSTNSVPVFPSTTGNGTITVNVRRSDGTTVKTGTLNVTRPEFTVPTISNYGTTQGVWGSGVTDRIICGTTTFEVTGGNGTSYNWVTTGGVSASSTTSSASVSATGDGTIKIYPVSTCGQGTSYALANIKYGAPGTPSFIADGDGNSFVNMCAGNSKYLVVNSDRANSYNFQLLNGSASLLWYGSNSASITSYNTGVFRVEAGATNCSGYGSNTKYINVINCSSGYRIGPNPATSTLTISYDNETPTELMPDNIKLLDIKMKEYYSVDVKNKIKSKDMAGTTIDIDVNKVPRGEYYLHITNKNHPDKGKRMEKVIVILQ